MDFLQRDEQIALELRALFHKRGYRHINPGRFEEYALYLDNKNFLDTDSFISFMDADGRLMAFKPDVTLSLIKNLPQDPGTQRLCYCDDVYRLTHGRQAYQVLRQVGVEYIAPASPAVNAELLRLALDSLAVISPNALLDISHMGFVTGLMDEMGLDDTARRALLEHLHAKNTWDMSLLLENIPGELKNSMLALATMQGPLPDCLDMAKTLVRGRSMAEAYDQLYALPSDEKKELRLDFSIVNDLDYYNGLIFRGYVEGVAATVLSGGRYDHLMTRMGKRSDAIGFAVTLNGVGRDFGQNQEQTVSVALPKGRLGNKVIGLLSKAGLDCPALADMDRKLVIEDELNGIRYLIVKPGDVAIYVEHGAADLGIAGKDTLLETNPDIYELLNLGLGKCRMSVAAPNGYSEPSGGTLRVATKYVGIAKRHYASISRDIDIIHLNGSIELAPLLGLSDVIVDIVETGSTLKQNNMSVLYDIMDISARLIANKAAYQFKSNRIDSICGALKGVL